MQISLSKGFLFSLLIVFCVYIFYVMDMNIKGHLPYVGHVDEQPINEIAGKMINTGDFNPKFFSKPTLPIYLNALGFSFGSLFQASKGEIRNTKHIGDVSYPFYNQAKVVLVSKEVFAFLSILAIFCASIIGFKAINNKYMLILPPIFIILSFTYMAHSWRYINVDIMGTFLIALLLVYILYYYDSAGFLKKAIIPGVICGLIIATKYTFFLILIPAVLFIILIEKKDVLLNLIFLILATVIAFIIVVPYSILDYNTFLNHLIFEMHHYSVGHPFSEGPAGVPQFIFYIKSIISQFGLFLFLVSILGIYYLFKKNWRIGLIIFSFPFMYLIFMSTKKVHFLRNMLFVYLLWSVFISMGFVYFYKLLYVLTNKIKQISSQENYRQLAALFISLLLLVVFLPYKNLVFNLKVDYDTRNKAIFWITKNVKKKSTIVIPEYLWIDFNNLRFDYNIKVLKKDDLNVDYIKENLLLPNHYFLIPRFSYDRRRPNRKKLADKLNKVFLSLKPNLKYMAKFQNKAEPLVDMIKFDPGAVLVKYYASTPIYNPDITIAKVK